MNKESLTTKNAKNILDKIEEWSFLNVSQEICGFIGESEGKFTVFLCENKSTTPRESFTVDPLEYLLFLKKYKPIALFHSHIFGNEEESEKDVLMSENSCLPFFIYSLNTKKFNFYIPKKSLADVITVDKFKSIK
jgi:proteasome lid subunit RPN8/RPN11